MFDPEKTRKRYVDWLRSPRFSNYCESIATILVAEAGLGSHRFLESCAAVLVPVRKWPLKLGLFLFLVGVSILAGIVILGKTGVISKESLAGWPDDVANICFACLVLSLILIPLGLNDLRKRWRARRKFRKMFEGFEVVLCGIVCANNAFFQKGGVTAPALLLGGFAPLSNELQYGISVTALDLADLNGKKPADVPDELRDACRLVNDNEYQPGRRRSLPDDLRGPIELTLFDAVLIADNWGGGKLDSAFVACAASPGPSGPIFHLPDEAIAWTKSRSGAPILRHDKIEEQEIVMGETPYAREIERHIERHLGTGDTVFHEVVSTTVHVDIHIVPPSANRNWNTLITSGMSTRPMAVPKGAEHLCRAELMLRLPANWPLGNESFNDDTNYWPLRWLKQLARFPHAFKTWLSGSHSIPNGDPSEPLHPSVKFSGWVVTRPFVGGEGFEALECSDGEVVQFFSIVPIFASEMELKLREGFEALDARFKKSGVTDLIEVNRVPVA